ncbi:hypothetical protein [Desulfosediminicola flagellatus]|uniref:hypothetical protein n=1 Tax=Desulfosediminicola flagellatus TaxID=2569541 RepID=UPI0012946E7B|nr:hypothetical protein [Desulfosediminicola flagellatus]
MKLDRPSPGDGLDPIIIFALRRVRCKPNINGTIQVYIGLIVGTDARLWRGPEDSGEF